jgi:hypothetical protein
MPLPIRVPFVKGSIIAHPSRMIQLEARIRGTVETLGVRQPPSDRRRVVSDPDQA